MLSVRTFVALGLTYLGLSLSAGGAQTDPPPAVVNVPDAALRRVLEDRLGLSEGAPIRAVELARLTVLEAPDAGIVALTGLEWATGLTRLDLGSGPGKWPWENSNAISDVSSLSGLTGLTWLSLSGNAVVNVSPLAGLTGLTYLNLQGNPLTDVSPLAGLTNLTELYLALTPLTEASSLSGLTGLTVHGLPWPYRYPKLGSLSDLVERYEDARATGRSGARSPAPPAPSVRVNIRTDTPARVDAVARFLADQGISARTWQGDSASVIQGLLGARVPVSLLVRLSEQAGVLRVWKEIPPRYDNSPSQGVSSRTPAVAHGATAWRNAGEGEGIRVGVIDGGFQGFSDRLISMVDTVRARCYSEDADPTTIVLDCETSDCATALQNSSCENKTNHGTAVTEALLGIAPNVSLYIANPVQDDMEDAVGWMIGEGVQVINHSRGMLWDGPGDGTSPAMDSPLKSVDAAVDAGILWVNAAGNDAKRTWFSDSEISFNEENFLVFEGANATGNMVDLPSDSVYVQLRWEDTWPMPISGGADRNLDLYLYGKDYDDEGMSMVAQSEDPQAGEDGQRPLEVLGYIPKKLFFSYCLSVQHVSGDEPEWVQLQAFLGIADTLDHNTGSGSINNPAESNNPGMLAVGAADLSDPPIIESYSARGPTPDDRMEPKPDLVGAVDQLPGTSYAAPRVAGLAALVIQHMGDDPSYDSPDEIATYLKNNALDDQDNLGPDNTWGHGFARLPALLAAPTMLTAVGSEGEIRVRWTDEALTNPAVTGYRLEFQRIQVGTEDSEEWSDYALLTTITNGSTTTYTHTTDATDYRYRYRVRARPAGEWSADFPENGVIPLPDPATVVLESTDNEMRVRLDCPQCDSSPGGSFPSYIVERKIGIETGSETGWQVVYTSLSTGAPARGARGSAGASGGSLAPSYTVPVADLDSTVAYQFRVRLVNADGQAGAASAAVAVVPLEVQGADGQATLSWTHPGYTFITQWQYRTRAGTALWEEWENISSSVAAATTETVSNLTNGVDYQFQVRALNVIGTEAITASFIVEATPGRAPDPVRSLEAAAENGQVTLSWVAPLSDGGLALTEYEYRQSSDGTTWPPDWTAVAPPLATSLTRTGLESCTFYTFEVRARNPAGPGDARRVSVPRPYWSGSLAADTTWSGRVCVDGDVTIPAGVTLTLAAETEMAFHPGGDATGGGDDPARPELIVAGTLSAGTGVTFRSVDINFPSTSDWSGIRVDSGGSADLSGATVRDGARCVQAHTSGTVTLTNTTLSPCGQSVSLSSRRSQVGVGLTATLEGETEAVSAARWQWQGRNDRDSAPAWADLAGASQLVSYTPVAADIGHRLRATVRYGPGSSSYSNYAQSAATRVVQGPPPTGFAVWPDHEAVLLLWDDSAEAPITHWHYGVKEGTEYAWTEVANSEVPATEYGGRMIRYHRIGGLSNTVEYRFKLRAQMDAGLGASTEAVRATPVQPQVAYGASSYEAREGGAAVEVGVALSAQTTRAVRLPLTVTADSGTEAGDYTVEGLSAGAAGAYTVSFTLGQSTQTFTLRANADEDEDDETVSLGLGTLPSGVRAGTPARATVTLRDIDVNEPPVITGGPTAVSFAENGTDSVATYRATDPEGAAIRWAWAGPDASAFTMRGDSLYFFARAPDYENPTDADQDTVYQVTVTASDGSLSSDPVEVSVTVTNVNEPPQIEGPTAVSFAENGTDSVATYRATDPEGAAIRWAWAGPDASAFTMRGDSLYFAPAPDYENPTDADQDTVYQVRVTASDGSLSSDPVEVRVTVTNVNEPPQIEGPTVVSFAENGTDSVATYRATDPEGAAIRWAWAGPDASAFTMRGDSLYFAPVPDYENPTDADQDTVYQVRVTASDGALSSDPVEVSVRVTDVEEPGTVTLSSSQPQVGTAVTATLSDPDGGVRGTLWQWQASNTSPASWLNRGSPGASSSYTPPDADVGYVLRARARYTDVHGSQQAESAPPTDPVRARPGGTVSYSAASYVATEDGDTATVRVNLSPAPTEAVAVKVTVRPGPNTEAGDFAAVDLASDSTVSFTATAASDSFKIVARSDADSEDETVLLGFKELPAGIGPGAPATATVNLLDATLKVVGPARVSVEEEGSRLVAPYRATDPWDGPVAPVRWSLTGADSTWFQMHGNTLEFVSEPDYEQPLDDGTDNVYDVNLQAVYGGAYHSAPFPVAVTVTNKDEPGTVSVSPSSAQVGRELQATLTDPDGSVSDTLWQWQYRAEATSAWDDLTSPEARFSAYRPVAADAGQYLRATVGYTDGHGPGKSAQSGATDAVQEASTVTIVGPDSVWFAENGTDSVATYRATDGQGARLAWRLGGPDVGAFTVEGDTLSFTRAPDFEGPTDAGGDNEYHVTVTAGEGAGSRSEAVVVTVTNVDEPPPPVGVSDTTFAENGTGGVATYTATDPEGAAIDWSLGGADADTLQIDAQGRLSFRAAPNYEAPADANRDRVYQVAVVASDGALSASLAVSVRVTNVEEPGTVTLSSTQPRVGTELTAELHDPDGIEPGARWQWQRRADAMAEWESVSSSARSPPSYPAASGYRPAAAEVGQQLRATVVDYSDGHGDNKQAQSDPTEPVQEAVSTVTIVGPDSVWFAENGTDTVATYRATDGQGARLAWRLGGPDVGAFTVEGDTLSFTRAPDFEGPADAGGDNEYHVTVTAGEGAVSRSEAVVVTVTNVDEPGTVTLSSTQPRVGTELTANLHDPDGIEPGARWQWQRRADATAAWESVSSSARSPPPSYPAASGYRPGAAEVGQQLRATVVDYSDGHGDNKQAQSDPTEPVVDVPEPPVLTVDAGDRQVTLNWEAASDNGSPIEWYEYRQASGSVWTTVSGGGEARTKTVTGLTNGTAYTFEVRAKNEVGYGPAASESATPAGMPGMPVLPNRAPQLVGPSAPSFAENGRVVASYTATDPEGDALRWPGLSGADGQAFQLTGSGLTRVLQFKTAPNYEAPTDQDGDNVYRVGVGVSDDRAVDGQADAAVDTTITVSVTVTNVNEPPQLVGVSDTSFAENGTGGVATYTATDPESDAMGWSLSGTDGQAFQLAGSGLTRVLQFKTAPNYEAPTDQDGDKVYRVGVGVSDDRDEAGAPDLSVDTTITVSVTLTNVEEEGTVTLSSSQPRVGTELTANLHDPDGIEPGARWQWQRRADATAAWESVSSSARSPPPSYPAASGYRPGAAEVGQQLRATVVDYSDGHGDNKQAQSDPTEPVVDVPEPPVLTVDAGDGQVTLNWEAASDNGSPIEWYEYRQASGSVWTTVSGGGSARAKTVTGLTNGTAYTFEVRAKNGVGYGPAASKSATPAGTPGTPGLTAVRGDEQVRLSWSAPLSDNGSPIQWYEYRQRSESGSWSSWSTVAGYNSARTKTVTGLTNGTVYTFEVRAKNGVGYGPAASESATPVAPNRAPQLVGPSAPSFAENGRVVASYTATDPEGDALRWPGLSGADGRAFQLTGSGLTRVLQFKTAPNFEAPTDQDGDNVYRVGVGVSDDRDEAGAPDLSVDTTITVSVTVANVDEAGTVTLSSPQPQVDVQLRADLSDPDGGVTNVRWSWLYSSAQGARGVWEEPGGTDRLWSTFTPYSLLVGQQVRARAVYDDGQGADKQAQSGATDAVVDVPEPPVLTVDVGDGQVTLNWTAASANGSTIQRYEYRRRGSGSWSGWSTVSGGGSARAKTVTGLTNGTAYTFEVRAKNGVGYGPAASKSATPAGTPGTPGLSAVRGDEQVRLSWTAASANGSTIQRYEYRRRGSGSWSGWSTVSGGGSARAKTVTGLTNGTAYTFEVRAKNGVGYGPAASKSATPAGTPGTPGLSAVRGDEQVRLSWTAASANGSTIQRYEYRRRGSGSWSGWSTVSGGGSARAKTVTGLTNGTAYTFEVRAKNGVGYGPAASKSATPAGVPGTPGLSAVRGDEQVRLSWTAASANGSTISWYEYRKRSGSGSWSSWSTVAGYSSARTKTVTGLTNGTVYTFEVRAKNGVGYGPAASRSATPAGTPGTPGSLSASAGDGQVSLSWTAASANGSSIQRYEYRRRGSGSWSSWSTVAGYSSARTKTVTGLTNGTVYTFEVRAKNGVGYGPAASRSATPAGTPGTPGSLSASAGDGQVSLSWTAASANGSTISWYEYRKRSGSGSWSSWSTVAGYSSARTKTVTGLTNGTVYTFEVRAKNGVGYGPAASRSATPAGTPGTPGSLSASAGDGQVSLSWTAASANGSSIQRYEYRRRGSGSWSSWSTVAGYSSARTKTVTGLTNGTVYTFEVRAKNGVGYGPAASRSATPAGTPGTPGSLSASAGDGQVSLSWTAASANGSSIQRYEYRRRGSGSWSSWSTVAGYSSARTKTVTGLTNGTVYTFEVRAKNGVGYGPAASRSATPAGAPGTPGSLSASAGDGQVSLSWTAASANGSSIQRYEYRRRGSGSWSSWSTVAGYSSARTKTVTGLTNGTVYTFEVRAKNGVGYGPAASRSATPAGTPGTPGSLSASAGDGQVSLSWTAASANGSSIQRYEYRRRGSGSWSSWSTVAGYSSARTRTVTGLTNGTAYTFEVRAKNGVGYGPAASRSATPAGAPGTPGSLSASAGDGQVSLSWTAASANGSSIQRYEYRRRGSGSWSSWSTVAGYSSARTKTVTGLTNGTVYTFEVRAKNGVGYGPAASKSATPAGVPGTPGSLSAVRGDEQVSLSWTAASSNGSTIQRYEYRQRSGSSWSSWSTVAGYSSARTKTVTGLTNGTAYTFEVRAKNGVGYGPAASKSATPAGVPGTPGSLSASAGDGQVSLSWTAASSNGSTIQRYEYRQRSGSSWSSWSTVAGYSSARTKTVTGLTNGTAYTFEVRAKNGVGYGPAASKSATPAGVPGTPGLSAVRGDEQVRLSWTAASANGSSIYWYECRRRSGSGSWSSWSTVAGYSSARTKTVTGLTNGTAYTFEVRAKNGVGYGPAASKSATPAGVPGTPGSLSASAGDEQVRLSWTAASANGSSIYWYECRRRRGSGSWSSWSTVAGYSSARTKTVTGLTNGWSYTFEVRAKNGVGYGPAASKSAIPQAPPPPGGYRDAAQRSASSPAPHPAP